MSKRSRPAVDLAIEAMSGVSRDGQPLSYNRAPSPDLAPWIARLYLTAVKAPADHRLVCGLFNDTAMLRIQVEGMWEASTADGPRSHSRAALFFGPQSHRMPITVTGSFVSMGISLRPGTCHALNGPKLADYVDRLVTSDEIGMPGNAILAMLEPGASPEEWFGALEAMLRQRVEQAQGTRPDPVTTRFEAASLSDPTISISEFARECGIEQRRLERLIRRDFGMPPKQVLRRARALDMASHLRGVADFEEAEELSLRFYDQSHLIHEFIALFGMTPRQFVETPQPILTSALESRQSRRLEFIERLAPGAQRPWQNAPPNQIAS